MYFFGSLFCIGNFNCIGDLSCIDIEVSFSRSLLGAVHMFDMNEKEGIFFDPNFYVFFNTHSKQQRSKQLTDLLLDDYQFSSFLQIVRSAQYASF
jgi:hypothetical protein